MLAVAGPALLVLGATWPTGLAARLARVRENRSGTGQAWAALIVFAAMAVVWRMPPVVDALIRHRALVLVQVVTLVPAGCALWLELVASPPMLPSPPRPLRASFAALAMWANWIIAYIMGFSRGVWFTAFAGQHGISVSADQQIAAVTLWALTGICFMPVIFANWISWLRDSSDPDAELRQITSAASGEPTTRLRPPRGWRLPSG